MKYPCLWTACATCAPIALGLLTLEAAEIDAAKLPPPAKKTVVYEKDIKPILTKACLDCHSEEAAMGDFRVDDRKAILDGGASGKAILPGQSDKSPIIHYVAHLIKKMEMPPLRQGDPLKPDQIALLRAWIDQGVKFKETDEPAKPAPKPAADTDKSTPKTKP